MKTLLRGAATLLTAALLCFNLFYELAPNLVVGPEKKFAFAAAFAILLRIALFCGIPEAQRQRRRRLYMQLLLYYYMWVLANVLFFDNAFGRGFTTHATLEAINLEPLRTIKNYLLAYGYGNISLRLVILNLAGNLIAFAPMGENGFGYDPVFFVPDKRKTFAQLTAEEKAEISHRGKALRAFKETLKNYLAEHQ